MRDSRRYEKEGIHNGLLAATGSKNKTRYYLLERELKWFLGQLGSKHQRRIMTVIKQSTCSESSIYWLYKDT